MLTIIIGCLAAIFLGPPALVIIAQIVVALFKAVFFIIVSPIILCVWLTDKATGTKRRYW